MNLLHRLVVVGQVEQDAVPGNGCAALCCCELGWSTIFLLCKHLKNLALRVVVILCRDSEGPPGRFKLTSERFGCCGEGACRSYHCCSFVSPLYDWSHICPNSLGDEGSCRANLLG